MHDDQTHHLDPELIYKRNDIQLTGQPDPGGVKLVLIGDSFTWGHGAGPQKTPQAQLEKLITNEQKSIHITNLATPGYSADQQLASFLSTQMIDSSNTPLPTAAFISK